MNARTPSRGHLSSVPSIELPAHVPAQTEACAHCGLVLMKVAGELCGHCHFVYCRGHLDQPDHRCAEVCRDCPPSWGA